MGSSPIKEKGELCFTSISRKQTCFTKGVLSMGLFQDFVFTCSSMAARELVEIGFQWCFLMRMEEVHTSKLAYVFASTEE